ncbi:MAG: hypothetical protein CMB80_12555 [Flammeovirgaceae bacterium]|nr:hypothetical protein [Flammeovirgaceae bacterium]
MSDFTSIRDILAEIPYVKEKETDMTQNTIKNGTDPIMVIRDILQQPTPPDLIRWKTQSINQATGKATMVAYTDARFPRKILDEAVGIDGWETKYERDSQGHLFCYITIHFPNGRTITKGDCGVPSQFESEKGEASDAFKRACFTWGICADLYDLDMHWVECDKNANGEWRAPWNWRPPTSATKKHVRDVEVMKSAIADEAEEMGLAEEMERDRPEHDSDPDPSGDVSNSVWMDGRQGSIGFTKNAQDLWQNVDESLLWWIMTTMDHISNKDDKPIPVSVDRKIKGCKEVIMRIETGEWVGSGWFGAMKECPLKPSYLKIKAENMLEKLSRL